MKGRVLVVDDDIALAEMLGIVLRGEGFDPVHCGDGEAALAAFRDLLERHRVSTVEIAYRTMLTTARPGTVTGPDR